MASTPNGKKENILTSWKEIAAYLDHDVRTCVRWEQRYGLPIHRLDRDSKGKVFAYREQIDEWLAARAANGTSRPEAASEARRLLRAFSARYSPWPGGRGRLLPFPAAGPGRSPLRPTSISPARASSSSTGRPGRARVVRHAPADLESAEFYREHFQEKGLGPDYEAVWPWS